MNREEGYRESECKSCYREPRRSPSPDYNKKENYDRFPCFAKRLQDMKLPHKFKPSNHSIQWERRTKAMAPSLFAIHRASQR
jgi:hypothetical protein